MNSYVVERLQCVACGGNMVKQGDIYSCSKCKLAYKEMGGRIFTIKGAPAPRDGAHRRNKEKWSPLRQANYDYYARELKSMTPDKIVLDLGTGHGQFRDLFQRFKGVVGIDFAPYEMVDVVADLSNPLPFKDNSFDLIFASNVFEHLPYPQQALEECARILKPGGTIILTVPFLLMIHQKPYDFYRYTNFALERMCEDAQLKNILIKPLGTIHQAYVTSTLHFFKEFYNFEETISNKFLKKLYYILIRIMSALAKGLLYMVGRIKPSQTQSLDLTLGYGVRAVK